MRNKKKFSLCLLVVCLLAVGLTACVATTRGIVVPAPRIAGAKFVGSDTCAMCHQKMSRDFKRTTHSRLVVSSEKIEGQACEACHGPGSLHTEAETAEEKRATMVNPGKNPEACYQCHLKQKAEFSLQYHHPLPEGKMTCTDCHDPHGAEGVKPGSAVSLAGKNGGCAKCHKDQLGPFVYEHEALRDGCSTCHNVHGSINDKMLVERDANLCIKCHYQTNYPTIGNSHSASRLQAGPCWSGGCHTAVHGSNYNDHLRI